MSSQVGPRYGGSHSHVPHWHIPLPLHSCWFVAIQEAVSIEQLQSSPIQSLSQMQAPHMHFPWPPHILLDINWSLSNFSLFFEIKVRMVLHCRCKDETYHTARWRKDSQSRCTRNTARCIFLQGFFLGCTHRSPPHTDPCRCKQGHLGGSDSGRHWLKRTNHQCWSDTVVQCKAGGIYSGHTPSPHDHGMHGCSLHGFSCSHTDLGRQFIHVFIFYATHLSYSDTISSF